MSRYIISDCHLGHRNIANFRKIKHPATGEYLTSEEQHDRMYEELCKIPKRATIFFLGDVAFDLEALAKIKALPCKNKILVAGNHDCRGGVSMSHLVDTYEKVYSLHKYKHHWLSHAPVHPQQLRGRRNAHGHVHYNIVLGADGLPDDRYISVCAEYTGYQPITWEYAISDEYQQECLIKWEEYCKLGLASGAETA
jgi:calcineurin-like phosphoesterase family protein